MVQYAEIKEVDYLVARISKQLILSCEDKEQVVYHLKKYHTILEGWYGDEQYHDKVEEGLEL